MRNCRAKQAAKQSISVEQKCDNLDKVISGLTIVELPVQLMIAIGPVCSPLSLEGRRGTGLWSMAWVGLEIWFL